VFIASAATCHHLWREEVQKLCSRCVWVSSDGGDEAVFWSDVNAWFFEHQPRNSADILSPRRSSGQSILEAAHIAVDGLDMQDLFMHMLAVAGDDQLAFDRLFGAKAISAGSPSVHNRMSVFEKRLLQNRADGVLQAIGQHRIQMTAVTIAGKSGLAFAGSTSPAFQPCRRASSPCAAAVVDPDDARQPGGAKPLLLSVAVCGSGLAAAVVVACILGLDIGLISTS
jgi:hypothetical protein